MNTTNKEQAQMDRYGITSHHEPVYRYKEYKYKKLQEAIDYAKRDTGLSVTNFIIDDEQNVP